MERIHAVTGSPFGISAKAPTVVASGDAPKKPCLNENGVIPLIIGLCLQMSSISGTISGHSSATAYAKVSNAYPNPLCTSR